MGQWGIIKGKGERCFRPAFLSLSYGSPSPRDEEIINFTTLTTGTSSICRQYHAIQFNSIQSPLFQLGKWISRTFFQTCLVTITSLLTIINLAQEFTFLSIPIDSYKRDYLVFMLSKTNNTNKNSNNLKYRYIITRNES